jgi:hypothetical protein
MSTILVDNLTGKTSAGSITVTSEGGAATQSLQQGLAKAWVNFNGTGTIASRDSLNVSGLVDNGTGDYTVNFSSSFNAADYCISGTAGGNRFLTPTDGSETSSSVRVRSQYGDISYGDSTITCPHITGDLA